MTRRRDGEESRIRLLRLLDPLTTTVLFPREEPPQISQTIGDETPAVCTQSCPCLSSDADILHLANASQPSIFRLQVKVQDCGGGKLQTECCPGCVDVEVSFGRIAYSRTAWEM